MIIYDDIFSEKVIVLEFNSKCKYSSNESTLEVYIYVIYIIKLHFQPV